MYVYGVYKIWEYGHFAEGPLADSETLSERVFFPFSDVLNCDSNSWMAIRNLYHSIAYIYIAVWKNIGSKGHRQWWIDFLEWIVLLVLLLLLYDTAAITWKISVPKVIIVNDKKRFQRSSSMVNWFPWMVIRYWRYHSIECIYKTSIYIAIWRILSVRKAIVIEYLELLLDTGTIP